MKTIKTAIIGCGAIHGTHVDAIACNPHVKLAAVVDIDEARAEASALKYGCDYYTDYKELLKQEDIEVVHICTPHYLHAPIAIDAMKAGKHVLTEKPMAINAADAEEMIRVSELTGKKIGICFQNRYNTTSERIKELLESGDAGKILGGKAFVTWHRDEKYYAGGDWRGTLDKEGGGVLINQAIHTLDLLQWFIGDVETLKASIDTRLLNNVIEVEDTAEATIKFKSGATGLFYATNCYCTDSPVFIELMCEKAHIRLESELTIKYANGETEVVMDCDKATGDKAYWGCGHKALINDFYGRLVNGTEFGVEGEQGITAVKLVNAIYKSDKSSCYVEV
jgi:UDP-N-acetyl-2-amino-2-deoxyglucuronate dehydrogenase